MVSPDGATESFRTTGAAYDGFMGRYSRPLAVAFADAAGVGVGQRVLDVGCGPGALTGVLADRLGASQVSACDPSPPFVAECETRHPGVVVRQGSAEAIPFEDDGFDAVVSQLVLHFVSDPARAVEELRRVVRAGGVVAASVWDFAEGMQMLRLFWDAALAVDPTAPDEARTLRFGREGEIAELFDQAGFTEVIETTVTMTSTYDGFDELWSGFLAGIGPAGSYCAGLADEQRTAVRDGLFIGLGSPSGSFALDATARCARATTPA